MNKILKNIEVGNSYEIISDEYKIKIELLKRQNNDTYIEFLSCEDKLSNLYNYDELILILIEIYRDNNTWMNNKIQYFIYDKNKIKINLNICEDDSVNIHYKINNVDLIDLEKISYFDSLGVNVFNRGDPFFNDICIPYSENDRDMVLKDRIEYIYQNYSICDIGCKYEKIEIETNTVLCNCIASSNFDPNSEQSRVKECNNIILQNSTLGVIRCYKLVFRTKDKYKNMGFWSTICGLIGQLFLLLSYFIIGIKPIQKYIEIQMKKYHYSINNEDNNNNIKNIYKSNDIKISEINNNINEIKKDKDIKITKNKIITKKVIKVKKKIKIKKAERLGGKSKTVKLSKSKDFDDFKSENVLINPLKILGTKHLNKIIDENALILLNIIH